MSAYDSYWPDTPPTRLEHHDGRIVRCFTERPATMDVMLAAAAADHSGRDAVIDGDIRLDFATLQRLADALATRLSAEGLSPGDRALLLAGNGWPFVVALLAVMRTGAIVVPLGTRMSAAEIAYVAEDCGAKYAIVDDALADLFPASLPRLKAGDIDSRPSKAAFTAHAAEPHDTAVILYTSGTTGRPKGAMLSHFNLVHSCLHYEGCLSLTHEDRTVLAVPASHVTGLVAIILAPLAIGAAVIVMEKFDADDFLALAAREAMTVTVLVPAMYNLCLMRSDFAQHDLSAWRIGAFGGAPMPVATMEKLGEIVPDLTLVQAYGSTETTSPATIMPLGRQRDALPSVGAPVPCADIRVMNEAGHEVPTGESGEVWIAGPMVSSGYWNAPEKTAEAFAAGYWRSGDIGRFDEAGLLTIHDRIKDIVNRGGYKVWSAEVENALNHHAAVAESAVIARPDPVLGEKTHAVVCLTAEADETTLRDHCATLLADYKIPDTFDLTRDPLPRNANGKIQKSDLRDALTR